MFNKKLIIFILASTIFILSSFIVNSVYAAQNPSYIMPDSVFINSASMNEQQIQDFLSSRGSYLANYTIPTAFTDAGYYNGTWIGPIGSETDVTGWRASRVIYQVSQWYGLNPQVTMATLFKEQSWITSQDATYDLARRLRWAMGYAVTESGIRPVCGTSTNHNPTGSCAGLAMQIDWGAGGLKFSYSGSSNRTASVSPYWAGNTINLEKAVYLGNNSTAALYRYTPHTPYSSNYVWFFNTYFTNIDYISYDYQFVSASPPPTVMMTGQEVQTQITLKNTGTVTWYNELASKTIPTRLAVLNGDKFGPAAGWLGTTTRIEMMEYTVASGENATFRFTLKMSSTPGTHYVRFMPVVENVTGMKDIGMSYVATNPIGPLYRFYDPSREIRYYTANVSEKDYIISHYSNWKLEKVEGGVYSVPMSGTVPVYRFYNMFNQTNYYTASWVERQWILTNFPKVWKYIGISWYSYDHLTTGSKPEYLLWSDRRADNLLTANPAEKDYLISHYPPNVWRYVGVQFYVLN